MDQVCQLSVMHPSCAEYWHMGAITIRLTRDRSPTCNGVKSLARVMSASLRVIRHGAAEKVWMTALSPLWTTRNQARQSLCGAGLCRLRRPPGFVEPSALLRAGRRRLPRPAAEPGAPPEVFKSSRREQTGPEFGNPT